jgi:hypothetical protein
MVSFISDSYMFVGMGSFHTPDSVDDGYGSIRCSQCGRSWQEEE